MRRWGAELKLNSLLWINCLWGIIYCNSKWKFFSENRTRVSHPKCQQRSTHRLTTCGHTGTSRPTCHARPALAQPDGGPYTRMMTWIAVSRRREATHRRRTVLAVTRHSCGDNLFWKQSTGHGHRLLANGKTGSSFFLTLQRLCNAYHLLSPVSKPWICLQGLYEDGQVTCASFVLDFVIQKAKIML